MHQDVDNSLSPSASSRCSGRITAGRPNATANGGIVRRDTRSSGALRRPNLGDGLLQQNPKPLTRRRARRAAELDDTRLFHPNRASIKPAPAIQTSIATVAIPHCDQSIFPKTAGRGSSGLAGTDLAGADQPRGPRELVRSGELPPLFAA